MEVRFVVVSPASQQRSISVRLPILVGRSEEAKFRIPKDSVSRRHCECFIEDGAVFVRDLGSTNGTVLDGELLPAHVATRVPNGATVRVGSVAFRVEYEPLPAPPPAHEPAGDDTVPLAEQPGGFAEPAAAEDETAFAWLNTSQSSAAVEPPLAAEPPAVCEAAAVGEAGDVTEPPVVAEAPAVGEPAVFADTPVAAEATAADAPVVVPEPPAEPPAAAGFDWLNASEAAPAAADDDKLDDFFKSLS